MGTNMAAGNQQKHLSLSFATKSWIYLSIEELKNKYLNFSDSQIPRINSSLGRHVNAASSKNLEIQAQSTTKPGTHSE